MDFLCIRLTLLLYTLSLSLSLSLSLWPCQRLALRKRVGVLNMGSFLHTSYEALDKFKPHPPHDVSYANLPRNNPKNRRGAPLPPGHSRVKLQLVLEEVGSDYINARSAIKHTSPIATSPWSHSCTPNSRSRVCTDTHFAGVATGTGGAGACVFVCLCVWAS